MRRARLAALAVAAAIVCAAPPAAAHEVQARVTTATATVVTLTYADGQPFAFEAFEAFEVHGAAGAPLAVGRTDAQGRAVFVAPAAAGELRLRAFSADGHGIERRLPAATEVAPPPLPGAEGSAPPRPQAVPGGVAAADADAGRSSRFLFGFGVLLALFGLIQLFVRRKKAK